MRYSIRPLLVIPVLASLLFVPTACALDFQLEKMQATQKQLRTQVEEYQKNNGGGPELTVFKHQLRNWIESKLAALEEKGDEKALQRVLNDSIKEAGLSFVGKASDEFIGYLDPIILNREGELITLITGVGIVCTYDESAYAYQWKDNKWIRIWMSEQTDYGEGKYFPQHIKSIQIWQPYDYDARKYEDYRMILSLGYETWCASNWHRVYWRVWRVDASGMKLMLDRPNLAFTPYNLTGGFSRGSDANEQNEILVEFKKQSIDDGVHNRQAVYNYDVHRDSIRRIDPIALNPRDFVDEWITSSWDEIAGWSQSDALRKQHEKLKDIMGEFSPTMHCNTPDLWQVTLNTINANKDYSEGHPIYFLVRWRPPYHFTITNISTKPWPRCNQLDGQADEWRTLFPTEMNH